MSALAELQRKLPSRDWRHHVFHATHLLSLAGKLLYEGGRCYDQACVPLTFQFS
jgi:hypothetical protein